MSDRMSDDSKVKAALTSLQYGGFSALFSFGIMDLFGVAASNHNFGANMTFLAVTAGAMVHEFSQASKAKVINQEKALLNEQLEMIEGVNDDYPLEDGYDDYDHVIGDILSAQGITHG